MLSWLKNNLMKHLQHIANLLMVITMFVGAIKGKHSPQESSSSEKDEE